MLGVLTEPWARCILDLFCLRGLLSFSARLITMLNDTTPWTFETTSTSCHRRKTCGSRIL
jgi:hypothetical protein